MEGREGMSSGVMVTEQGIKSENPSPSIHPNPHPNSNRSGGEIVAAAAVSGMSMGVIPVKKKRGRPRKYGPDGNVVLALTPFSLSRPGNFSSKRGRGRPTGSVQRPRFETLGDWVASSAGGNFTPHVIAIAAGEDVTMKIMSFTQQGPRAICILSANGAISSVTLRQPDSSGGTLTYEGRFEILSLSGSFTLTETGGTKSRSGGMSVSLSSPDGRVVGGGVAGQLVAASPVQVVVGSFMPNNQKEQIKKPSSESTSQGFPQVVSMPTATAIPISTADVDEAYGMTNQQISAAPKPNHASASSSYGWASLHSVRESKHSATDINISLPGS